MVNAPPASSPPLAGTLRRITALDEYLASDLGPLEAGWHLAGSLLGPDAPALAEGLTRVVAHYPAADRRVTGAFFTGEYAWYLAAAAVAAYLAEGRVPDLSHENIALRYRTFTWHEHGESGESERFDIRFLSGRFAALPGDPDAGCSGVQIQPDADGLRNWLRSSLEGHLAPVIDAVAAQTRLSRRAQWNLAADAIAALFLHAGKLLGDEARGQAEGLAVVKAAGSPLRNPDTGYITVEIGGHCETFRARGGCCLFYRMQPGENCSTCVLRPEAERTQMLRDHVAHKHNVEVSA